MFSVEYAIRRTHGCHSKSSSTRHARKQPPEMTNRSSFPSSPTVKPPSSPPLIGFLPLATKARATAPVAVERKHPQQKKVSSSRGGCCPLLTPPRSAYFSLAVRDRSLIRSAPPLHVSALLHPLLLPLLQGQVRRGSFGGVPRAVNVFTMTTKVPPNFDPPPTIFPFFSLEASLQPSSLPPF